MVTTNQPPQMGPSEAQQTSEAQPQPPQYISADDIMYHMALGKKQDDLNTAIGFWAEHLMRKYGLSQDDGIAPDGKIVRNAVTQDNTQTQSSSQ